MCLVQPEHGPCLCPEALASVLLGRASRTVQVGSISFLVSQFHLGEGEARRPRTTDCRPDSCYWEGDAVRGASTKSPNRSVANKLSRANSQSSNKQPSVAGEQKQRGRRRSGQCVCSSRIFFSIAPKAYLAYVIHCETTQTDCAANCSLQPSFTPVGRLNDANLAVRIKGSEVLPYLAHVELACILLRLRFSKNHVSSCILRPSTLPSFTPVMSY